MGSKIEDAEYKTIRQLYHVMEFYRNYSLVLRKCEDILGGVKLTFEMVVNEKVEPCVYRPYPRLGFYFTIDGNFTYDCENSFIDKRVCYDVDYMLKNQDNIETINNN